MSIDKKSTRVRRSPEASRENILNAAETLLVEHGPQTLKLTDVAKAAKVANATVLHHFGTIQGVQAALMERMIQQLANRILDIDAPRESPFSAHGHDLRMLFDAFEQRGAARLAAWLELADEARRMTSVREAVEAVIEKRVQAEGAERDMVVDFTMVCVALALGVGLFGSTVGELMGRPEGRTREMALEMMMSHLQTLISRAEQAEK